MLKLVNWNKCLTDLVTKIDTPLQASTITSKHHYERVQLQASITISEHHYKQVTLWAKEHTIANSRTELGTQAQIADQRQK